VAVTLFSRPTVTGMTTWRTSGRRSLVMTCSVVWLYTVSRSGQSACHQQSIVYSTSVLAGAVS